MKIIYFFTLIFFLCASCTDEIQTQKEEILIDSDLLIIQTKHINGTIKAGQFNKSKKTLIYKPKRKKIEGWVLSYDNSEITISPVDKSFANILYYYKNKEKLNSSFSSTEIIESDSNSVLIKKKDFVFETGEIEEEGYIFSVFVNGFELKGSGENPLKPINNLEQAKKLILISKTFKPSK